MKIELINIGQEEIVSAICQQCIKEINAKDLKNNQIEVLLNEFSPKGILSYSNKYKVYVAKNENNEIMGTGTLANNQIKGVFVDTKYFGKGIGKSIMQFLENRLKEIGYKKSFLTSSKYAKDFYLRLGYKQVNVIDSVVGEMTEMEKTIL
jgi:citrate lyase synthetase